LAINVEVELDGEERRTSNFSGRFLEKGEKGEQYTTFI